MPDLFQDILAAMIEPCISSMYLISMYLYIIRGRPEKRKIKTIDRGEPVSTMEPLLLGDGSRHRGGADRPCARPRADIGRLPPQPPPFPTDLARRPGAVDELLLLQPY